MGKPKLLILGWARHGKDTVAEMLRDHYGYKFQSSSHAAAELVCRPAMAALGITYDSLEQCYEDRVNHRATWYEAIKAYNHPDPARLAKEILKLGDMYVGMRSAHEYAVARDLFDLVVWVDASGRGVPPEPRSSMDIDYDPEWMRLLRNDGDLEDLKLEVAALSTELRDIGWGKYMASC